MVPARLGEMMAQQKATVGLAPAGRPKIELSENSISPPTLAEAGIDTNLAYTGRRLRLGRHKGEGLT
jgi:hypothetical protein